MSMELPDIDDAERDEANCCCRLTRCLDYLLRGLPDCEAYVPRAPRHLSLLRPTVEKLIARVEAQQLSLSSTSMQVCFASRAAGVIRALLEALPREQDDDVMGVAREQAEEFLRAYAETLGQEEKP